MLGLKLNHVSKRGHRASFNAMPMGLGDDRDSKPKKLHSCAWHKWRNAPCRCTNKWVQYIRHVGLSSDKPLTWQEGLVGVLFLVTAPLRKQNHFFLQDIWFNICSQHRWNAVNHVCKGHVNTKVSNYQSCSIFTAGPLTTRLHSGENSTCST